MLAQQPFQAHPLNKFHHQKVSVTIFAAVMRLDDVGMGKPRQRPCLALKTKDGIGVIQARRWKHLDSDQSVQLRVACFEDGAHTAFAELFEDTVTTGKDAAVAASREQLFGLV